VALHLRGDVRAIFMDWLRAQRPDLVTRYEELYSRGAYAPKQERERLARLVRRGGSPGAFWRMRPSAAAESSAPTAGEPIAQDTLF
jgi:hypothetical protein